MILANHHTPLRKKNGEDKKMFYSRFYLHNSSKDLHYNEVGVVVYTSIVGNTQ